MLVNFACKSECANLYEERNVNTVNKVFPSFHQCYVVLHGTVLGSIYYESSRLRNWDGDIV